MAAYYNEIDPYAAEWLRNLIKNKHIADGDVDERSICEVDPQDIRDYTQCHFFAGIGGWSYALRLAGWPDDRPVWTGSCPCQPFSSAGQRKGVDDERHLWPAFFRLIAACEPATVFGEQVASKDGLAWLDLVCADLERSGYAVGAADLCAAGVGAPHIRQRLWWVANSLRPGRAERWSGTRDGQVAGRSRVDGMADAVRVGQPGSREMGRSGNKKADENWQVNRAVDDGSCSGLADAGLSQCKTDGISGGMVTQHNSTGYDCPSDGVVNQFREGLEGRGERFTATGGWNGTVRSTAAPSEFNELGDTRRPNPPDSHWRDADWLFCRDGRFRAVRSGTFPLANGISGRVGRLRAYGNAIVPQVAAEFIGAYLDT